MTDAGKNDDTDESGYLLDAIERMVLDSGPRYAPEQVWTRTGVTEEDARQLWLAMGFPHIPAGEAVLTDRDVDALGCAKELLATETFDMARIVRQTRVMSQAMATIAASQVESLDLHPRAPVLDQLADLSDLGEVALPALDRILSYMFRRHLLVALERVTLVRPDGEGLQPLAAVGFADLAGFTSATAPATEEALTDLVDVFSAVAADLVAERGGRVVKLIGDEIMFTTDDPAAAADVVLGLVEAASGLEGGLPAHAGVAFGPVLRRRGDVFGMTVNRASRLTDAARPGTALVDDGLATGLGDDGNFILRRAHLRPLKGVGTVKAFVLRRSPAPVAEGSVVTGPP
jgi:adenylate cyclase